MKQLFFIAIMVIALNSWSQKFNIKFGKVSQEELELTECSFYPEATSMKLGHSGNLNFRYDNNDGWKYEIEVIERIKIFKLTDKDQANVRITRYDPVDGNSKEELLNIKGYTYNLVDGKMVKTKLTNSEEYQTRINDYRVETRFAMPEVQEGSVIEYSYTILSDFISTLYTWHFQHDIPTAISEFRYTIPEFFNYSASHVGNVTPLERFDGAAGETFTYRWEGGQSWGGGVSKGTGTMTSNSKVTMLTARDMPPLEDEPMMNNMPEIPSRMEFQLISTKFPNQIMKMIATDYEQFNKTIMDWESFGKAINKGGFAKEKIATLSGSKTEIAAGLYQWIQQSIAYNGYYGSTSSKAGRNIFNEGAGNVADINLSLVAAYREAGLDAFPVLVSTRGHGIPHPVYPNYQDYNYVIAAVMADDKLYLTDATTKLPFGVLPVRCLNNQGWLASENGGQWIDLKKGAYYNETLVNEMTIENGQLKITNDLRFENYAFYQKNDELKENEKAIEEQIANAFPDFEISEYSHDITDGKLNVKFTNTQELDADNLYLQPITHIGITQNPFKRETRMSPIDFNYFIKKRIITKIIVPDGYEIELPEPTSVAFPQNAATFNYTVSKAENQVMIMSIYDLRKTLFTAEEYPMLKQFYELMAQKHSEMVVIKKS